MKRRHPSPAPAAAPVLGGISVLHLKAFADDFEIGSDADKIQFELRIVESA